MSAPFGSTPVILAEVGLDMVMVWHLLADPTARNHVRQLEALGFTVTLATA